MFILTGRLDVELVDEIEGVDDDFLLILFEMMDDCPDNRPELSELIKII